MDVCNTGVYSWNGFTIRRICIWKDPVSDTVVCEKEKHLHVLRMRSLVGASRLIIIFQ